MTLSAIRSAVRHRVFHASLIRGVALALAVASSIVIARIGGADVKGLTSTFASASIVAFTLVNLDVAQQLLQDARQTSGLHFVRSRITSLVPGYGVIATVVGALGFAFGRPEILWLSIGTFCYLVSAFTGFAANGISGPEIASWGAVLQQLGLIVAALIAWSMDWLNNETAPAIVIFSFLAPLPLYFAAARPKTLDSLGDVGPPSSLLALLFRGLAWQPARLAQMMLQRLDLLTVFVFLGPASAGVYSVGLATSSLAGIVPAQFASNVTYEVTHGRDDLLKKNAAAALVSGLGGALVLLMAGKPLLPLAYGDDFSGSYGVLACSLPGAVAYGIIQVLTNQVRLAGGPRAITLPSLLGVLVMAAALALLLPVAGTLGAAVAFSLGSLTTMLAMIRSYRRHY